MAPVDFAEWNMHFKRAELPLRFLGKPQKNLHNSPMAHVREEVTLAVVQGDSLRNTIPPAPSRLVRPVLITEPKIPSRLVGKFGENDFVLAPTITPRVADQLRQHGVMFADKRGNCFVSWPGVLIDIRGRTDKAPSISIKVGEFPSPSRVWKRTASLFTPRRAQVSALVLAYPGLLELPIREIAVEAEVSVGTANQTIDLLVEAGYLRKTRAGYRIDSVDTLLDAWAHAYPTGLGASREVFRGTGDLAGLADLKPSAWVSGERAVPHMVRGGHTAHLYVEDEMANRDIIRAARLRRDDAGEVIIRSAFWNEADHLQLGAKQKWPPNRSKDPLAMWPPAPLPVIYADLLSVGDPRLSEVAQQVRSRIKEQINHFNHRQL